MTETEPAIRFSGVRIDRGERTVLQDVDLVIPAGSVTVIFGPSGAGKSTLLQAATGELAADAGSVRVLGRELPLRHAALFELRRSIGVLLQGSGLLSDLDVFENVALPLRTHTDLPEALVQRIVHMKLNAVGLAGASELSPQQLSGGMIRRVALARALVLDPPLMLYDEPLTGLDPIAIGVITSLIVGLNRTLGLTSVLVTHHIHESLDIADRVVVIANRTIAFDGTREELAGSRDPLLAQFLEGKPDGPIAFDYERAQRREVARAAS